MAFSSSTANECQQNLAIISCISLFTHHCHCSYNDVTLILHPSFPLDIMISNNFHMYVFILCIYQYIALVVIRLPLHVLYGVSTYCNICTICEVSALLRKRLML